jgi:hypothetical protein
MYIQKYKIHVTFDVYVIRRTMPKNLKTNITIFGETDITPGSQVYLGLKKKMLKYDDCEIPTLHPIMSSLNVLHMFILHNHMMH